MYLDVSLQKLRATKEAVRVDWQRCSMRPFWHGRRRWTPRQVDRVSICYEKWRRSEMAATDGWNWWRFPHLRLLWCKSAGGRIAPDVTIFELMVPSLAPNSLHIQTKCRKFSQCTNGSSSWRFQLDRLLKMLIIPDRTWAINSQYFFGGPPPALKKVQEVLSVHQRHQFLTFSTWSVAFNAHHFRHH